MIVCGTDHDGAPPTHTGLPRSDSNATPFRDRLKELLRTKLIECGWRDELKEYCKGALPPVRRSLASPRRNADGVSVCLDVASPTPPAEVIRSKGLEKITVDELVAEITPRGRATVPDEIKADLLQRIRKFLQAT